MPKIIEVDDTPKPKAKIIEVPEQEQKLTSEQQIMNLRNSDKGFFKNATEALPAIGAIAGGFLGPGGSVAGTGLGSVAKQQINESVFGQPKQSGLESLEDIGLDQIVNNLIPAGVGKAVGKIGEFVMNPKQSIANTLAAKPLRYAPPVQEAINKDIGQTVSRRYLNAEPPVVETAAARAQGNQINPYNFKNTVGEDLANLPYNQTGPSTISQKDMVKRALSDVSEVRNWKIATGEPFTIEKLAMNKVVHSGYDAATGRINVNSILRELDGPSSDIYKEAIRPQTAQAFRDFLKTAKDLEGSEKVNSVINYAKGKIVFLLPFALGSGVVGGMGKTAAGIVMTDVAIGKLMQNPEIAKLTIQALKTPAQSNVAPILSKVIMDGMRGTNVLLKLSDGTTEKAQIDDKGQLTYPHPN